LDLGRHLAYARPADVNYYTQPRELNDVHIVRSYQCRPLASTTLYFGQVRVTDQVIGFRRRQQYTEALLSEEPLDLPSHSFETQAIWFEVPESVRRAVVRQGLDFAGGLHAVEHACIGLLPLYALCDRNDIGGLSTPQHPDTGQPQIFIYDAYAGGVGIAKKGCDFVEELWQSTLDVVQSCPCESGCPSCIQSPKCGNNNEPLDKGAAVVILQALLKRRP
jgi:DEAD/DEAH box helicase domain-containing protein